MQTVNKRCISPEAIICSNANCITKYWQTVLNIATCETLPSVSLCDKLAQTPCELEADNLLLTILINFFVLCSNLLQISQQFSFIFTLVLVLLLCFTSYLVCHYI